MKKKLTLKTLLEFIDMLEEGGDWLWSDTLMKAYFSDRKENLYKKLRRYIESGLIVRVAKGLYANPRSKHRNLLNQAYDVAGMLRRGEFFYESFESRASELGLISQVPNKLTFATTGRSYFYKTPFGWIEFVHKDMDNEEIEELLDKGLVVWNEEKKVFEASEELTEEDLRRYGRSLDLLEETVGVR